MDVLLHALRLFFFVIIVVFVSLRDDWRGRLALLARTCNYGHHQVSDIASHLTFLSQKLPLPCKNPLLTRVVICPELRP